MKTDRNEMARLMRISQEVRAAGGAAEEMLGEKCNRERRTRMSVIKAWGDPREWDSVKRREAELRKDQP